MQSSAKTKCTIILLSILNALLMLTVLFLLYRNNYLAVFRQMAGSGSYDYQSNAQYIQRESLFESLPAGNADIIFVGDSITARCEWQEFFPDKVVLNRGIDSDVTEGVLNRLDVIEVANPRQIYLMIGINDIRQKIPMDVTVTNYKQIIEKLTQALPDTELFIQSVLPIGANTGMSNEDVMALNEELVRLADAGSLTYIDLYSLLADDQNFLPQKYSVDGVHLTGDGYRIWLNAIRSPHK